jgi:hypothetical protein
VPLGSWETITFVAALRHNKMTAPMVTEGAMTGELFLAYVEQCLAHVSGLAPSLHEGEDGVRVWGRIGRGKGPGLPRRGLHLCSNTGCRPVGRRAERLSRSPTPSSRRRMALRRARCRARKSDN